MNAVECGCHGHERKFGETIPEVGMKLQKGSLQMVIGGDKNALCESRRVAE